MPVDIRSSFGGPLLEVPLFFPERISRRLKPGYGFPDLHVFTLPLFRQCFSFAQTQNRRPGCSGTADFFRIS